MTDYEFEVEESIAFVLNRPEGLTRYTLKATCHTCGGLAYATSERIPAIALAKCQLCGSKSAVAMKERYFEEAA